MKNALAIFAVLCIASTFFCSCNIEQPHCQKITYIKDSIEITIYQWMTVTEAHAIFDQYEKVRITTENYYTMECLMQNEK